MSNSTSLRAIAINFQSGLVPDWVQLTPSAPEFEGRDGRRFRLSNPQSIVDAFVGNGVDLPIDYEHATQIKGNAGEPAPAVGWIKELSVRMGQIWGRVEWTNDGGFSISEKQYRYLSPAFTIDKASNEILQMISAGLTNRPNLEMASLNRRANLKESENMDKAVLEALGLAQNATAADAVVAINKLREAETTALNSVQIPDTAQYVPRADHDLALNKIEAFEAADVARADEAVTNAVDAAVSAGKIAPASKDFHIAACRANGVDVFNEMLKTMPVLTAGSGMNEQDLSGRSEKLGSDEIAVCNALGMSEQDFANGKVEQEAK